MSDCSTNENDSCKVVSVEGNNNEKGDSANEKDDVGNSKKSPPLGIILIIWKDNMVTTSILDNRVQWKCLWCGGTFFGRNATKAVLHLVLE